MTHQVKAPRQTSDTIGSYYLENFPKNAGRIVLDGATDSSISVFEVGRVQATGFQRALENYLAACPTSFDDCPFTGGADAALATIRELYDRYDATPVAAPDGRMMDAGVIDIAFFLADFYYSRDTDGAYTDNSLEAFIAIYCVDYPVESDTAVLVEQQKLMREASPTTYRDFPPTGDLTCLNWPYKYIGPGITELTGEGAPPVLIISTTGDPATPYEWGVALSEQLQSAQLITYNGEGHTAYNGGVACIDNAVDDYFVSGTVPDAAPRTHQLPRLREFITCTICRSPAPPPCSRMCSTSRCPLGVRNRGLN